MTNRWDFLRTIPSIQWFPPATESDLIRLPIRLPDSHLELLRFTDGLLGAAGDIRVFGLGSHVRDQVLWNGPNEWKFAQRNKGDGFWCFADMPSGPQFAYEVDKDNNLLSEQVVYVDANMVPGWTLPDFKTFIDRIVVKPGSRPFDPEMEKVYARTGPIPADKMIMPIPPRCFDGPPDWEREMMVMDARAAMIIEGDMAAELKKVGDPKRMETYKDERGLTRIRLVG